MKVALENLALVRVPGIQGDVIQVFQADQTIKKHSLNLINQIPNNPIFICSAWNDTDTVWVWEQYLGSFTFEEIQSWQVSFQFRQRDFSSTSPESYSQMMDKALAELRNTTLDKVVLAREKVQDFQSESGEILLLFQQLCEAHPKAFVYVCSSNQWGTWMGASPEILLSYQQEQVTVMSLAGTLFNAQESWTDKERSEQSVTSKFIEECLEWGPSDEVQIEELRQGNLRHLMSIYRKPWSRNQLDVLLRRLSPTPAVAGFPKTQALAFIQEQEELHRDLYAGFIGIHQREETQLYVNLRCAELGSSQIRMIAGGGINVGSNTQREWQETELKMSVIGGCLS